MADNVSARVLDLGLNVLDTECDKIVICSAEPTTFTEADATFKLAQKTFAVGGAFGSPAAGTPNGRKVTSAAITDGTVTANGTGLKAAAIDTVNSRLLAVTSLAASQALTAGNTFSLAAFDIRLPSQ